MIRIIAAATAIALSASPLYAGKTSSRTIVPAADQPAVCDNTIFDYAANYSAAWAIQGMVKDWFLLTEPNIPAFINLWNNTHPDNKLPEGKAFNEVIAFTLPEGSTVGPAGEYVFLYQDGCYVADMYVPPQPDNATPPQEADVHWVSLKQWQMMGSLGLR